MGGDWIHLAPLWAETWHVIDHELFTSSSHSQSPGHFLSLFYIPIFRVLKVTAHQSPHEWILLPIPVLQSPLLLSPPPLSFLNSSLLWPLYWPAADQGCLEQALDDVILGAAVVVFFIFLCVLHLSTPLALFVACRMCPPVILPLWSLVSHPFHCKRAFLCFVRSVLLNNSCSSDSGNIFVGDSFF